MSTLAAIPLLTPTLSSLSNVLYGHTPQQSDIQRWQQIGFNYDNNITFGLVQPLGGPCGILAPVQAYIIHNLLFVQNIHVDTNNDLPLQIDQQQQKNTLITVLLDILKRCSINNNLTVVLGETLDQLNTYTSSSTQQLHDLLLSHYTILQSDIGILLFVYSLLLTRTIDQCKDDMDDISQPLIARFGHTTQELVNLLITGKCVSNVFNGQKIIDKDNNLILKGIDKSYNIGYLTLLESLRYSEVGSYYKQPQYPIWVIGSETHYTILFGCNTDIDKVNPVQQIISYYKTIFDQYDTEQSGMIPLDNLQNLLQSYNIAHIDANQAMQQIDTDNIGVILWSNVLNALKQWFPNQFIKPTKHHTKPYSCTACTYINQPNKTSCEICGTIRPSLDDNDDNNRHFRLYHLNGLQQYDSSSNTKSIQCIPIDITLHDLDTQQAGQQTNGHSLIDIIQTKWINATVDYKKEPKIS